MSEPFGIRLYSPLSELTVLNEVGGEKYFVEAPKPHPTFTRYLVQASDSLGVVWVKGLADNMSVDAFGNSLRAEVDRIADQVKIKYGVPEKTDFLLTGSIWDEPQYWMNALDDGQRYYAYSWKRPRNSLADDLDTVYIGAAAASSSEGGVIIEFASTRLGEHEKELETKLSDRACTDRGGGERRA